MASTFKLTLPVIWFLLIWSYGNFGRSLLNLELKKYKTTWWADAVAKEKMEPVPSSEGNETLARRDVLRVWSQYKLEHSDSTLRHGLNRGNDNRKFAVGYYSCPLQAGNRLHHFMNSLIWAVVTNRTLLWKYYDMAACQAIGGKYNAKICLTANTVEDCGDILERAEWLPSFHEWASHYDLGSPLNLSFWTTHEASTNHKFWFDGADKEAGLADSTTALLVDFPQMLGQDAWVLHSESKRKALLTSKGAQQRAALLFRAGADYLYGLLFFECFGFQPSVTVPVQLGASHNKRGEARNSSNATGTTIVVHSRHSNVADDGATIRRETECLDRVLRNTSGFCQVMILSDRPKALDGMMGYLLNTSRYSHCHTLVAPHDIGNSFSREHGVFAGKGFYQDLAMVSNQTRHIPTSSVAFIGSKHRSSSQLVREVMTFQLHQQYRYRNSLPAITTCYLDDI